MTYRVLYGLFVLVPLRVLLSLVLVGPFKSGPRDWY